MHLTSKRTLLEQVPEKRREQQATEKLLPKDWYTLDTKSSKNFKKHELLLPVILNVPENHSITLPHYMMNKS